MKKVIEYTQNKIQLTYLRQNTDYNVRKCPECGLESIKGMPGGRDATCHNCGFKDPCCYD